MHHYVQEYWNERINKGAFLDKTGRKITQLPMSYCESLAKSAKAFKRGEPVVDQPPLKPNSSKSSIKSDRDYSGPQTPYRCDSSRDKNSKWYFPEYTPRYLNRSGSTQRRAAS